MKQPPFVPAFLLTLAGLSMACDTDPYASDDAELAAEDAEATPSLDGPRTLMNGAGPVAQLPGFDVGITLDGDDVVIDWADQGATEYEVWTSDDPFFSPQGGEGQLLGVSTGVDFTVSGANSPAGPDAAYYVVVFSDGGGTQSSTTVGHQRLTLYPGYNKVPLSLQTDLSDASGLYESMSPDAAQVHTFDPFIQDWVSWDPTSTDAPFPVGLGGTPVVEMDITDPVQRTVTGYVPGSYEIMTMPLVEGDNLVTVPLHYPEVDASVLLAVVPNLDAVGRWDPEAQQMMITGITGSDFTLAPGDDMHLFVSSYSFWPLPLDMLTGPTGGGLPTEQGDCCSPTAVPGCTDPAVETCVCAADAFCCDTQWDGLCTDQVTSLGCGTCS